MRWCVTGLLACVIACAGALPDGAEAALQDENLLLPLPPGFRLVFESMTPDLTTREFVSGTDTQTEWSRKITMRIFHTVHEPEPDKFAARLGGRWREHCPGGEGLKDSDGRANGYMQSVWIYWCPRDPDAGKPEMMWMKAIAGADAMYTVQYAYRQEAEPALAKPTKAFLSQVSVCDTRQRRHRCPRGM